MFFVKIFEIWNKIDHARQLLVGRKDSIIASANDEEKHKKPVSET
jgi:hypothetical protein